MNKLFNEAHDLVLKQIGSGRTMVFATSANNITTARTVSAILHNDVIYFTSFNDSLKCDQIRENDNTAFCIDSVQLTSKSHIIEDLTSEESVNVLELLKVAFPYRAKYNSQPGCVIVATKLLKAVVYDPKSIPPLGYSIDYVNKNVIDLMK